MDKEFKVLRVTTKLWKLHSSLCDLKLQSVLSRFREEDNKDIITRIQSTYNKDTKDIVSTRQTEVNFT